MQASHDRIRRDRVRAGRDRAGSTRCKPSDGRPLANIDPRFRRRPSEAARVVERVQVSRAAIHKTAVKVPRRHLDAQRSAVEHVDPVVVVPGAEMLRLTNERAEVARPVGSDGDAGLEVALDLVPGNAVAHERLRLLGHRPEKARSFLAKLALKGQLIAPVPAAELPAVAARCAVADAPRFEQHRPVPTFGKVERAGEPGIAAAA